MAPAEIMLSLYSSLLFFLLTARAPCVAGENQEILKRPAQYVEEFVPFLDFLVQTEASTYEEYEGNGVLNNESFVEMKTHILTMYGGIEEPASVTSFVLDSQYGDCLLINEQPTVKLLSLKEIPIPPISSTSDRASDGHDPGNFTYADSPLKFKLKDQFSNSISCPQGTIPMARITLATLTRSRTLNDYFSKPASAQLPSPDLSTREVHLHAQGFQSAESFGGNSFLNLWIPTGDFSISQQWYLGSNGDDPLQTVEGGWVMDLVKHPERTKSTLFIYYNADGYSKKTNFHCWNLDCPAFCQTNHNWFLGGPWDHYSTLGGDQWGFEMQWKLFQGNWWLFLKGRQGYEAVGYYPGSVYRGGQISRNVTQIQYGGEVANYTGGKSFPQMGSGIRAEKGWEEAAFQNTVFWIPRDEDDGVGIWADLLKHDESAACYSIDIVEAPDSGDWGTYLFFGGAGGSGC